MFCLSDHHPNDIFLPDTGRGSLSWPWDSIYPIGKQWLLAEVMLCCRYSVFRVLLALPYFNLTTIQWCSIPLHPFWEKQKPYLALFLANARGSEDIVGVRPGAALAFPSGITGGGGKQVTPFAFWMCRGQAVCVHWYFYSFMFSFIHQYLVNIYQVLGIVLVDRDNRKSKVGTDCARWRVKSTWETEINSKWMVWSWCARRRE